MELLKLSQIYQKNHYIVIDGFFDKTFATQIIADFPGPKDVPWYKYDNIFEKKYAFPHIDKLPASVASACRVLNSSFGFQWLQVLTGIEGLEPDETYRGGGLHMIETGGKLDIHADFNIHPGPGSKTGYHRRVNLIWFACESWEEAWGGEFEIWKPDMSEIILKVQPAFNRAVIFNVTDDAFHGHPDPLRTPENIQRRSLAWYYYTKTRPEHEITMPHSTVYKKRPQDITTPEIEELRTKRGQGRLTDMQINS